MAKTDIQKCDGGGVLSGLCWLLSFGLKLSVLVALFGLLITVYQLNATNNTITVKLTQNQKELAGAVQQKQAAHEAYTDAQKLSSSMQSELANSRADIQKLQVQLSKAGQLQDAADTNQKALQAAEQQVQELNNKLHNLQSAGKDEEQKKTKEVQEQLQTLKKEKASLEHSVSSLQSTVRDQTAKLESSTGQEQKLTQELNSKQEEVEKLKSSQQAKEKEQKNKIEELTATITKLQTDAKSKKN